jgi:hypothetical protein
MTDKHSDRFVLSNITAKLKSILAGERPGIDEITNVPSKRGATKPPFDAKYRAKRKIRMRMQKQSRRINRARR